MVTQRGEIGILEELYSSDSYGVSRYDIDDRGEYLPAAAQLPDGVDGHTARK